MPFRPFSRDRVWLLPPSLGDLIPEDHAARFVAAFVDGLDRANWAGMGIEVDGDELGAPAYHPQALLGVWLYGFLIGVRSARKLELACRDQLPFLWLTGWQHPDHNTLWRFYKANRQGMRQLLKRTVKTAVRVGLVDLAVQAVDGCKISGNASRDRSYKEKALRELLERTEAAIRSLEAQNQTGEGPSVCRLPAELSKKNALKDRVEEALKEVVAEEGPSNVNLTDGDARLVKSRQGMVAGYNAQAMVSPLNEEAAGKTGLFITAADVTNQPDDHSQLVPMIEAAKEMTGREPGLTLADGGYHSGSVLAECQQRVIRVLISEGQKKVLQNPYHKDRFVYEAQTDSYICPEGQTLIFGGTIPRGDQEARTYRSKGVVCRACPAFGKCTKDKRQGRKLQIGPYEDELRQNRTLMETEEAKALYGQRKELPEPVFGILKELLGARRFLLRGLSNVL
ncbi:MAG: IS1182 family transposase, partial [Dehalococcoidia bacterium]|nr:IS1182 family transposase [Dehalococcoidia bacterium]